MAHALINLSNEWKCSRRYQGTFPDTYKSMTFVLIRRRDHPYSLARDRAIVITPGLRCRGVGSILSVVPTPIPIHRSPHSKEEGVRTRMILHLYPTDVSKLQRIHQKRR
jgi:hypothetical protein